MKVDLGDLNVSAAVARVKGFRGGARLMGVSASGLSEVVRRLKTQLGVRLLNRTTRSASPTETGQCLPSRLRLILSEVEATLDAVNSLRERSAGTLKLNVPVSAVRLVLPVIILGFLDAYPETQLGVVAEGSLVDILVAGPDAGICYNERLEQDMIVVPVGPRSQRFAMAAAPGYLDRRGCPNHPRNLLDHACLRGRFASGAMPPWEFERDGEAVNVGPSDPLLARIRDVINLVVDAAVAGVGVVHFYEDWPRPYLASGALESVLEAWWHPLLGPYLYYPGWRLVPASLGAFIDFVKAGSDQVRSRL